MLATTACDRRRTVVRRKQRYEPKPFVQKAISKHYGSIAAAARRMGINDSYLGRVARGERQPTYEMATRIAKYLGITTLGVLGPNPPAETRAERMSRNRRENKTLLSALARIHKTESFRRKMKRAGQIRQGRAP